MGSKYTTQSASGYAASPPSDDGSATEANKVKFSTIKQKLGDPVKTLADNMNSALVTALNMSARAVTASDSAAATDHDRVIQANTASIVITLADAATMAAGYTVSVSNQSAGNITVNLATATDTIDGVTNTTHTLGHKEVRRYIVNAAATGYILASGFRSHHYPPKHISGLTYSNNGSDATNDIDISSGTCRDATNAIDMALVATLTKRLDAGWAVGTNQGGLDTGSIGNSDYYIWLIARTDTGVVDVLFSLSSTAPTMPANYTMKRLIGWFKRVGGSIVAFDTYETEGGGLEMNWDAPTLDVDSSSLTTARLASAVKVPLDFSTTARLRVLLSDAGGGFVLIQCPDETDAAPSGSAAPGYTLNSTAGVGVAAQIDVRTSATGTIAARASAAMDSYRVVTIGFRWARRD